MLWPLASRVTTEKFNLSTEDNQFTTQPLDQFAETVSWKTERNATWVTTTMTEPLADPTAPSQDVVMVFMMPERNAITDQETVQLVLATNGASGLPLALLPLAERLPAAHLALRLEIPPLAAKIADHLKHL
jgi:hypothetical protein